MNKSRLEFSKRLNMVLDEAGFIGKGLGRQVALGKKYGVSQRAAGKWLEGESIPRHSTIMKLSEDFDCSSQWLEYGSGEKRAQMAQPGVGEESNVLNQKISLAIRVPVISDVQAGDWEEAVDNFHPGDGLDDAPRQTTSPYEFGLIVTGVSMQAPAGSPITFHPGEIIHVNPEIVLPDVGNFVVAKLKCHDRVTFKQYRYEDGRPFLYALNPAWDPIFDEFRVIGKVVGKSQKF